jgi:hypothetical protein
VAHSCHTPPLVSVDYTVGVDLWVDLEGFHISNALGDDAGAHAAQQQSSDELEDSCNDDCLAHGQSHAVN